MRIHKCYSDELSLIELDSFKSAFYIWKGQKINNKRAKIPPLVKLQFYLRDIDRCTVYIPKTFLQLIFSINSMPQSVAIWT